MKACLKWLASNAVLFLLTGYLISRIVISVMKLRAAKTAITTEFVTRTNVTYPSATFCFYNDSDVTVRVTSDSLGVEMPPNITEYVKSVEGVERYVVSSFYGYDYDREYSEAENSTVFQLRPCVTIDTPEPVEVADSNKVN